MDSCSLFFCLYRELLGESIVMHYDNRGESAMEMWIIREIVNRWSF